VGTIVTGLAVGASVLGDVVGSRLDGADDGLVVGASVLGDAECRTQWTQ